MDEWLADRLGGGTCHPRASVGPFCIPYRVSSLGAEAGPGPPYRPTRWPVSFPEVTSQGARCVGGGALRGPEIIQGGQTGSVSQAFYCWQGRRRPGFWKPGAAPCSPPPRLRACRASGRPRPLEVVVAGGRERGHKHDELAELHLGVPVGVQVLEQFVHGVPVPFSLEIEARGQLPLVGGRGRSRGSGRL